MPTPAALEELRLAEQEMRRAQEDHLDFIERPNRGYSPAERAENERLLQRVKDAIEQYSQAFQRAARS